MASYENGVDDYVGTLINDSELKYYEKHDVPSKNLVARIGTDQWTGKDALNKMYQIVLVEDAKESYSTGELQPLEFY